MINLPKVAGVTSNIQGEWILSPPFLLTKKWKSIRADSWDREMEEMMSSVSLQSCAEEGFVCIRVWEVAFKGRTINSFAACLPQHCRGDVLHRCALRWMQNAVIPQMSVWFRGVRLVSQLTSSGNHNTQMKNAFFESLYELPYTETTVDSGTREGRQEHVFEAGSQHEEILLKKLLFLRRN